MYIVVRKRGLPEICGSIKAISQVTDIPLDRLYYHLSRKKKVKYETDGIIILKRPVVRAKN